MLGDSACYARRVEDERLALAASGSPLIDYWSLTRAGVDVDPLYGEPDEYNYDSDAAKVGVQGFRLVGVLSFNEVDNRDPSVVEGGKSIILTGRFKFSRDEWERKAADGVSPSEGDVLKWGGRYFEVVKASQAGMFLAGSEYVGWNCEVASRSEFTPDRRLGDVE